LGSSDLDELAVGLFRSTCLVGVVLQGEFSEDSVDLLSSCGVWHTEGGVVIIHDGNCYREKMG
jgi:hypothetical protein